LADFAFAFMDCEFGGLDPELHDITEIAVIITDYRLDELAAGEWKIAARPHRITRESAEISGYRAEDWQGAPHLREVLAAIDVLLPSGKTVVPAGQNVRMDVSFLERAYRSCERPNPFDYHVIDLATLFYTWSLIAGEPVAALSLRQAAVHAGLIDGPVPHRAMADARLTLDTFRYYVGRLALRPLSDAPVPVIPNAPDRGDC
jgi:oligoribonuclease (3'-5' exoribonuclease)